MSLPETLEMVPLASLKPHPRNYHEHPQEEIDHLKASIQEHGVYRNIVIAREGTILAGHGVVLALQQLGHQDVAVERMPYPPYDARALKVLAGDNAIARLARRNEAALGQILADVASQDVGALLGTGYDAESLAALLAEVPAYDNGLAGGDTEPQIDRAEALRQQWGTAVGQLWACGGHRIICGDCADKTVVERLLCDVSVHCCLADPPYNVGLAYTSISDQQDALAYNVFTQQWFGHAQARSEKQIVTPGCYNLALWLQWFPAFYVAPWIKTNALTPGYVSRFFCWEPIVFYGGEWFYGDEQVWPRTRANDVFNYPVSAQTMDSGESLTPLHPCPKPLALWADLLETYTPLAATIYDPFIGSGTTPVVCHNLGRVCYGADIDPGYVAVTLERFMQHTGMRPVLLDQGSFHAA